MTQPYLVLAGIRKAFGAIEVLKGIDLEIGAGEFVCFLGPSGCGKTTLLRAIAGLDRQTSGRLWQAGREISTLPPSARDFGIVFQSYALFPNLTVFENIAYGLVNRRLPKPDIKARVGELARLTHLEAHIAKYPAQLSGGQQQRVALARALALSPGLLLLDEPLSALDAQVRGHLRAEIRAIQRRLGVTTIMVPHDQEEALTMADRIVLMNDGRIEQVGSPREVYSRPATPFTAAFIGQMNVLSGVWADGCARVGAETLVAAEVPDGLGERADVTVCIRPEDIGLTANGVAGVAATIAGLEFCGSFLRLHAAAPSLRDAPIVIDLAPDRAQGLALGPGMECRLHLPGDRLRLYAGAGRP